MKKIMLFAAIAALAVCCSQEQSPVEKAIADRLSEATEGVKGVTFETVELVNTVTLGQELEYRLKIFQTKCELEAGKYQKYSSIGNYSKAKDMMDALEADQKICQGIEALRESLKDSLDNVVYSDYKFSAFVDTEKGRIHAQDYYAVVSPDMKVLKYSQRQKGLHNGVGGVIPGYLELLGNVKEE